MQKLHTLPLYQVSIWAFANALSVFIYHWPMTLFPLKTSLRALNAGESIFISFLYLLSSPLPLGRVVNLMDIIWEQDFCFLTFCHSTSLTSSFHFILLLSSFSSVRFLRFSLSNHFNPFFKTIRQATATLMSTTKNILF